MLIVASAFSVAGLGSFAAAQPNQSTDTRTADADNGPEIVIVEPLRQRSMIGAPIQTVSLSRHVSYQDLDLNSPNGAYEFRQRIRTAAHAICNKLAFRYPVGTPDTRGCYKSAETQAQAQADAIIGEYRKPMASLQ
jgi:UrcA family protein